MGVANIMLARRHLSNCSLTTFVRFEAISSLEKGALVVPYHTAFYTPRAALGVFFFEAVLALIPLDDDS